MSHNPLISPPRIYGTALGERLRAAIPTALRTGDFAPVLAVLDHIRAESPDLSEEDLAGLVLWGLATDAGAKQDLELRDMCLQAAVTVCPPETVNRLALDSMVETAHHHGWLLDREYDLLMQRLEHLPADDPRRHLVAKVRRLAPEERETR